MQHDPHHGADAPALAAPDLAHHAVVDLAPLGAAAAPAAGLTVPHQDEARELGSGAGFSGHGTADPRDCAEANADRKHFVTLAEPAARAGYMLHELACGGFLLCRWGMAKELPDLRAVAAMLGRIGAPV